jgi:hypothetical protein
MNAVYSMSMMHRPLKTPENAVAPKMLQSARQIPLPILPGVATTRF